MKIFGIDPGSERTGFGCIESSGSQQRARAACEPHERSGASGVPASECVGGAGGAKPPGTYRLIACGALTVPARATFPEKLTVIHTGLAALLARHRPECVAVENIFYARNVRSALKLGHARGVALLAAAEAGIPVVEYAPAEIKRAIVGYGRAEKGQMQQMVKLLLGLETAPSPHDAADALAVAICHVHLSTGATARRESVERMRTLSRSWRDYRP